MKKLTLNDLDDLAIGAAVLGSGGGGDPAYPYMMARYVMETWGEPNLISISELKPSDVILPIAVFGAPLAEMEKIGSGHEFGIILDNLAKTINKKATAVLALEIGGGNAFTPMMIASKLGIPIVDADAMGRAFPEAQMTSCALMGGPCSPGFFTDCLGNSVIVYANDSHALEKIGRQITVSMGSTSYLGMFPLTGAQVEKMTFHKSISRAISIGKAYHAAKQKGENPLPAILHTCKGKLIATGIITDIDRVISKGFLKGKVVIQNKTELIEIIFQNEFLLAKINGKVVATTPDIISLLEVDTGFPIASESLQYGIKVNLIGILSPELWTTPKGLELVGPRYFGYNMDYIPFTKIK